eukprot:CAMPEP_0202852176 /NCGR_PEP_ID=MMETSP1389-20130828/88295_1 /ASSEMBLY_ACC=CAM_ASM_000865 /TAXON_ID=302021 /ORGANISM="Rhodomonas sp., Strain CCMP768" /LENGTH=60 /DNA_ID=CAMNT_0049530587 /DNA_START=91 /DNA_END=268 /DNA_ORIENTATION=-
MTMPLVQGGAASAAGAAVPNLKLLDDVTGNLKHGVITGPVLSNTEQTSLPPPPHTHKLGA